MVADGMGAHAVGELASKMACDLIPHNYMKAKVGTPAETIVKAFREVSALVHSRAAANREFQGMGTTCSAILLLPEGALVAHVGDSRVYRMREERIDQLSFDHSLVWELVRRNRQGGSGSKPRARQAKAQSGERERYDQRTELTRKKKNHTARRGGTETPVGHRPR